MSFVRYAEKTHNKIGIAHANLSHHASSLGHHASSYDTTEPDA